MANEKDPPGVFERSGVFRASGLAGDAPAPLAAPGPPGADGRCHRARSVGDSGRLRQARVAGIRCSTDNHGRWSRIRSGWWWGTTSNGPDSRSFSGCSSPSRTSSGSFCGVSPCSSWRSLSWFIVLFTTRLPEELYAWLLPAAYVRYGTHVYGYLLLAASPFPGFTGTEGSYPVDLEIDPPAPQSRWKTAVRILLAIPALFLSAALVNGSGGGGGGGNTRPAAGRTRPITTGAGRWGSRSRSRSSRGSPAWCGRGCPTASATRWPTPCATRRRPTATCFS